MGGLALMPPLLALQDSILKGRFSLNIPYSRVEYRWVARRGPGIAGSCLTAGCDWRRGGRWGEGRGTSWGAASRQKGAQRREAGRRLAHPIPTHTTPPTPPARRKKLPLGQGLALALAGSCSYANIRERSFDPVFGVQLEFGDLGGRGGSGPSAVLAGDTFDVRQKFRVAKGLRLEVGSALPAVV